MGHCPTITIGQIVILEHRLARRPESQQQEGRRETRAVLAARAVEQQRIAASILRDGEGSTIFFDVIDTEEPILGDDAPLELRRADRALLDQTPASRLSRQE